MSQDFFLPLSSQGTNTTPTPAPVSCHDTDVRCDTRPDLEQMDPEVPESLQEKTPLTPARDLRERGRRMFLGAYRKTLDTIQPKTEEASVRLRATMAAVCILLGLILLFEGFRLFRMTGELWQENQLKQTQNCALSPREQAMGHGSIGQNCIDASQYLSLSLIERMILIIVDDFLATLSWAKTLVGMFTLGSCGGLFMIVVMNLDRIAMGVGQLSAWCNLFPRRRELDLRDV
jgi:hypothetical protein